MKLKYEGAILILLIFSEYLFSSTVRSVLTLNSLSVLNNITQSTVTIHCDNVPTYTIFFLHNPERIVIDFLQVAKIKKNVFPIRFNDKNLIKCIRSNVLKNYQNTRIVCDLNHVSYITTVIQKKIKKNYQISVIIAKKITVLSEENKNKQNLYSIAHHKTCVSIDKKQSINNINNSQNITNIQLDQSKRIDYKSIIKDPIIVAIDAGHGGQDPGATGCCGIYEKNITFSIARKLKKILDMDPIFKAVMIRDGDYFLSVMDRSDLARKKKANVLVSIHVDSSLNTKVRGASVWILSNQRARVETVHWLQHKDKHSELLGGLGDILTNYHSNPYFNHVVLDLQFGYTQRVGHKIALQILNQLKDISVLHKKIPEYSGFGILRSPDIPSILVETGFISNCQEEYLLATNKYQEKIAQALYKGLKSYFVAYNKNC